MRCSLAQLGTHLGDADTQTQEVFYSNASARLKSYLAYAAIQENLLCCCQLQISLHFSKNLTGQLIHSQRQHGWALSKIINANIFPNYMRIVLSDYIQGKETISSFSCFNKNNVKQCSNAAASIGRFVSVSSNRSQSPCCCSNSSG